MKILVLNCGSTTIKYQLIDMEKMDVIAKGKCDKVGIDGSVIEYKNVEKKIEENRSIAMPTHKEACEAIFDILTDKNIGVVTSLNEINAVGHRAVHGGEKFKEAVLITDNVIDVMNSLSDLAPLHSPAILMGIDAIKKINSSIPNVAVFDTAFHQSIPEKNYLYGINYNYYKNDGIRKYGFHGTSYEYILNRLTEILNKPKDTINCIVCHLGGGASMCAIKDGKSYDTSMGFTPLEGLLMETRSGDLDPAIVTRIMKKYNLTPEEMELELNKKSGRLGLCGIGDHRAAMVAIEQGNELAKTAIDIQTNRTKKYIGAYMAELNRVDAIVFTAGIGENSYTERESILSDMDCLGIELDFELNKNGSRRESLITKETSKIPVYIIPTNEELEIAIQTEKVISNG
ncbi:MAG: acetate kinase [Clostridia bacterium]